MNNNDYYNDFAKIGILITNVIYIYGLAIKDSLVKVVSYFIMIIVIMFFRKEVNDNLSKYYFNQWLNIIFTNKIVFVNVIGNIGLYIPLVYLINKVCYEKTIVKTFILNIWEIGIIVIILSIIFEVIQYILNLGVFDFMDIVLNVTGILLFIIIHEVGEWVKKKTKKEKN